MAIAGVFISFNATKNIANSILKLTISTDTQGSEFVI
jgi:hypothetical protein